MGGARGEQTLRRLAQVAGGVATAPQWRRDGLFLRSLLHFILYLNFKISDTTAGASYLLEFLASGARWRLTSRLGFYYLFQRAGAATSGVGVVVHRAGHDRRQVGHRVDAQQQHHGRRVLHYVLRDEVKEWLSLGTLVCFRTLRGKRPLLLLDMNVTL